MTNVVDGYVIKVRSDGAKEAVVTISKIGSEAGVAAQKVRELSRQVVDLGGSAGSATALGGALGNVGGAASLAATSVKSLGAALVGGVALRSLATQADSYSRIQSQLAQISETEAERQALSQRVFDLAQETRTEFEAQAKLVTRLSVAGAELGVSQDQVLVAARAVSQTFAISGASAGEAASSAQQLAQALASGTLQGDELRAILENNQTLAIAIAKGFGVSVGQLRQMGADGRLLSRDVLGAILGQADEINVKFGKTIPTLEQGFGLLENAAKSAIGKLDQSLGISREIVRVMQGLANYIDPTNAERIRNTVAEISDVSAELRVLNEGGRSPATFLADPEGILKRRVKLLGDQAELLERLAALQNRGASPSPSPAPAASALPPAPVGAAAPRLRELARDAAANVNPDAELFRDVRSEIERLRQEARGFFEDTLTPAEKLAAQIARVTELRSFFSASDFSRVMADFAAQQQAVRDEADGTAAAMERVRGFVEDAARAADPLKTALQDIERLRASGRLTGSELNAAEAAMKAEIDRVNREFGSRLTQWQQAAVDVSTDISEALADSIAGGFEGGFDLARRIAADALRQIALEQIRAQAGGVLKNFALTVVGAILGQKLTLGSGSDLSKSGGSIGTGAGKALGGPVREGRTYLVGETGPELFTPGSAGRITPAAETAALGGAAPSVVIVNERDPEEFLQSLNTGRGTTVFRNMVSANREEIRRLLGLA